MSNDKPLSDEELKQVRTSEVPETVVHPSRTPRIKYEYPSSPSLIDRLFPRAEQGGQVTTSPLFIPDEDFYPTIYVTRQVMGEMYKEVMEHPLEETSWGIYGPYNRKDHSILICGILPPGQNAVRRMQTTEFGSEDFGDAMRWLRANFLIMQRKRKDLQDLEFDYRFAGHSHYTLGVRTYSGTDRNSILRAVQEEGMEFAIGPLANIDHNQALIITASKEQGALELRAPQQVTIRFYFYSRAMWEKGMQHPVLLRPHVTQRQIYGLPIPLPWTMVYRDFYQDTLRRFKEAGCEVRQSYINRQQPPLKIQFSISHPKWRETIVLTTNYNFPEVSATVDSHPKRGLGRYPHYQDLVELVHAVEKEYDLTAPPKEKEGAQEEIVMEKKEDTDGVVSS